MDCGMSVTVGCHIPLTISTISSTPRQIQLTPVCGGDRIDIVDDQMTPVSYVMVWAEHSETVWIQGTAASNAVNDVTIQGSWYTGSAFILREKELTVDDVVVTFSKTEVRPGRAVARSETVTATATRLVGGPAVTIDLSICPEQRATVSPQAMTIAGGQTTGNQELTVAGTGIDYTESGDDQDSNLVACMNQGTPPVPVCKGCLPVTVTIPKTWKSSATSMMSTNPVPILVDLVRGLWTLRWNTSATFTVYDQHGRPLSSVWTGDSGVLIQEAEEPEVGQDPSWVGFTRDEGDEFDQYSQAVDPIVAQIDQPRSFADLTALLQGQPTDPPWNPPITDIQLIYQCVDPTDGRKPYGLNAYGLNGQKRNHRHTEFVSGETGGKVVYRVTDSPN